MNNKSILTIPNIKIDKQNNPFVSVIIVNKNCYDLLTQCVESFFKHHKSFNGEILIGDTGSNKEIYKQIKDYIKQYNNVKMFNVGSYLYSKNNNDLVKKSNKEAQYYYFVNNDIEFLNNNLDQFIVFHQNNKNIGTLGSHLVYLTQQTQHSGIFIQQASDMLNFHLGHVNYKTYVHEYNICEVFGNTGASLFIESKLFKDIGGFDENMKVFQDVKLNIEVLKRNKINFNVGTALAYHLESYSRKQNPNDMKELQYDIKFFQPYLRKNKQYFQKYIRQQKIIH